MHTKQNNKNRHNVVEKTGINEIVQENFTSPALIQYPRHKGKHLGADNIMKNCAGNNYSRWLTKCQANVIQFVLLD